MAEKASVKKTVKGQGKFGTFMTGTGGGEPIAKGKKWTDEKRDPDQPRTDDRKFTYNAVNGKELKDISKKNGHSRGTTIPPTLTGGKNGIHYYTDKEHSDTVDGADEKLAKYANLSIDEVFHKGQGIITFSGKVKIATKDFVEAAQEFVQNKKPEDQKKYSEALLSGDFAKTFDYGHFSGDPTVDWENEKEATTPKEKQALAKAEEEGTKGKELVEHTPVEKPKAEPTQFKPASAPTSSPVAPVAPKQQEPIKTKPVENEMNYTVSAEEGKHEEEKEESSASLTPEQLAQVAPKFKEAFADWNDEMANSEEGKAAMAELIEQSGGFDEVMKNGLKLDSEETDSNNEPSEQAPEQAPEQAEEKVEEVEETAPTLAEDPTPESALKDILEDEEEYQEALKASQEFYKDVPGAPSLEKLGKEAYMKQFVEDYFKVRKESKGE